MKSHGVYKLSWLLVFLPVFLMLCFMAKPLRAEEEPSKDSVAEQVETREAEPPEPRVYSDDWKKYTDRISLIAHFDLFYTLSDQHGSNTISGGGFSGLLAPTYKFNDKNFLILMYDGTYYKRRDFYSDDVGPRERTEFQRHTITPMFRIDFGEKSRYSITPSFFYTKTYNKDVEGTGWDDGLYNYRDTGGGLDFRMKELGYGGADGTLKLGAQYYKRRYPNYDSLLDLATGLGIERDEKDYHGLLVKAGYDWSKKSGFSWGADYYLLHKRLDDKKVVGSDGVLTSEEQEDYLHSLDLRFWRTLDVDGGLRVGLDLNYSLNRSNQNYYDGMGTWPDLSNDVFLRGFYDYNSYRIRPNISYTFALFPLTPSFAYSYQRTDYTERRAQYSNGIYKSDKQYETQNETALGVRYDLFEDWSIYARWQYIAVRSNNSDKSVYEYDHTVNNYSVGVSYRY